ncbi:MAG: threonylcarbamoyl-AMP synthase [Clostridiaceae bacterium]|nr:threonylcarbamoyl-AMP synthase [Clostridiaceae bacterium]
MKTEVIIIDPNNIENEKDKLSYAAAIIKNGGLVAFPTETVYGLGANAMDREAVKNIFKAKGRPSDNPLIVHISSKYSIDNLVTGVPSWAQKLVDNFWPGPLTLIFKKTPSVPDEITAGLETLAIRMPAHPVALSLIDESGLPIVAPSANKSGKPSPTTAAHVFEDLAGKIDLIIDGGPTRVGIESTVLDITSYPPVVLRPGGITLEQLRDVLGEVRQYIEDYAEDGKNPGYAKGKDKNNCAGNCGEIPRSPGLKYKHYSPAAKIITVEGELEKVINKINELVVRYEEKQVRVGVLATNQTKDLYKASTVISMGDRNHPDTIASNLFNCFREFDNFNMQVVLAESIDKTGIGLAVMNRLIKASGYNIIRV